LRATDENKGDVVTNRRVLWVPGRLPKKLLMATPQQVTQARVLTSELLPVVFRLPFIRPEGKAAIYVSQQPGPGKARVDTYVPSKGSVSYHALSELKGEGGWECSKAIA